MNFEFLKSFFKNFQKSEVESRPSRPFQFSTSVEHGDKKWLVSSSQKVMVFPALGIS